MADESGKPGNSDDEPDYKKWAVGISIVAGIVSVLVGINSLTGVNLLKETFSSSSGPTSTSAPTRTTGSTSPRKIVTEASTTRPVTREATTTTTRRVRPQFVVRSSQWDGPCGSSSCAMSAVFANSGGTGSGSATFYVLLPDRDEYLARCSAVLPTTSEDDVTRAGCVASSGQLQRYFQTHPGGTVRMNVKVDN